MATEPRTCQSCKSEFTIEPEDFAYYTKVNVPPPTWCPECRLIRRMCTGNMKYLYLDTCDLCGKKILSMFSPDKPYKVYCNTCWWSDKWEGTSYARDYDFSKPFFEQLQSLLLEVPQMALSADTPNVVNSDYCNGISYLKNCYWCFFADYCEDCFYGDYIVHMKDSFECLRTADSEFCLGCVNVTKSYRALYSVDCENSSNISFCIDCTGCQDCFGCAGLRKKQYCIFNVQYSEVEYNAKIKELNVGSFNELQKIKDKVREAWLTSPRKFMRGINNQDVTGDYISNTKNVKESFFVSEAEDCKYSGLLYLKVQDSYDYTAWGNICSLVYDSFGVGQKSTNIQFSVHCWENDLELRYSVYCLNSSSLFGCGGLRKKQYCILNKQYTKEEYEALIPKIRKHMDEMPYKDAQSRTYRFGEFFPPDMASFGYNESFAQEFFPKDKTQVEAFGGKWHEFEAKQFNISIPGDKLPDDLADAPDSLSREIIGCAHEGKCDDQCTTAYKILPQELAFYKKLGVALPRLCPNCRLQERRAQLGPMKLWKRRCACEGVRSKKYKNIASHFHASEHCPNEFETSYSPERKETVYCEQCYQSEIV